MNSSAHIPRQLIERRCEAATAKRCCIASRDHHYVTRKFGAAAQPKPLAHAALDVVPLYRIAHLATHCNAQANTFAWTHSLRTSVPGRRAEHNEVTRRGTTSRTRNPLIVTRIAKPVRPRKAAGGNHDYFEPTDTARRLRPFARRRLSTARPARVFIRSRKPCVRFLRIRLG